jgi:hypothetical protein
MRSQRNWNGYVTIPEGEAKRRFWITAAGRGHDAGIARTIEEVWSGCHGDSGGFHMSKGVDTICLVADSVE